jgi:hypothetical protein
MSSPDRPLLRDISQLRPADAPIRQGHVNTVEVLQDVAGNLYVKKVFNVAEQSRWLKELAEKEYPAIGFMQAGGTIRAR